MIVPQLVQRVVLFPLLLPVWQERPLTGDDIIPGPYPLQITEQELALQRDALGWADPHLRSRIAVSLGDVAHREAGRVLLEHLGRERDPAVLATVLTQLLRSPIQDLGVPGILEPLLRAERAQVRARAVRLFASVPACEVSRIARVAREDPDAGVRMQAWQSLVHLAPRSDLGFLRRHWADADPRVRALALSAACRNPMVESATVDVVAACDDSSPLARLALAEALRDTPGALAVRLAERLTGDKHASVRAACVAHLPALPDRERSASLLAAAIEDVDPEVRRLACAGLGDLPNPDGLVKLVARFGDPMRLVREQAGRSVVAVHQTVPATARVHACLASDSEDVRVQACRTLGDIGAGHTAPELARLLEREERPENVAAVVYALGSLRFGAAAAAVAHRARHDDPEVRAAVARALGRLRQSETYGALETLALDPAQEVRQQALLGIRESADGRLSRVLLKVLKSVAEDSGVFPEDRSLACWSSAVLRPVSNDLMERLVVQATTPVIPMIGGKEFEQDFVLVSACWALASCAREDGATGPLAEAVLTVHERVFNAADLERLPGPAYTLSPEVREYARQARAFLGGEPVQPRPRPTGSPRLCIRPLAPEEIPE